MFLYFRYFVSLFLLLLGYEIFLELIFLFKRIKVEFILWCKVLLRAFRYSYFVEYGGWLGFFFVGFVDFGDRFLKDKDFFFSKRIISMGYYENDYLVFILLSFFFILFVVFFIFVYM